MATLDHLGIAVRTLEEGLQFYRDGIGLPLASVEEVPVEKVRVAMLQTGESRIELLEATNEDSAIARFVAARGPGLHHVALRVPDLTASVSRLRDAGAQILGEPRPGAGGQLYVFVHPKSAGGVLLELIQE